jgi:hypothetical protein
MPDFPQHISCVRTRAPRRSQPLSMAIANKISATAMSTNSDKVCIYLSAGADKAASRGRAP